MRRYQCRGTTYFRRAIEKMLWPRNHLFGSRIGFASFDVSSASNLASADLGFTLEM
jgi:hypothetical protein